MKALNLVSALAVFLAATPFLTTEAYAAKRNGKAPVTAVAAETDAAWRTPEGVALLAAWAKDGYSFTPAVKSAYLAFAKAGALRDLGAAGIRLPDDFMKWVDGDPVVSATVYGARHDAAKILVTLRSLEIDLGAAEVRGHHTQLALAMAVVHSAKDKPAFGVSLEPRPLLALTVPGNPLVPVNTHPKDRPADTNDLIVNFFEGRTVDVTGKGGKRTVPMAACDVIADPELQKEFNAYMKANGRNVTVDCGDHLVSRNSIAAVKGPQAKGVHAAYELFKAAYVAKGLLPGARDAEPTLAETCAWLIRNDATALPEGVKRKWAKWPLFPLEAPWPVLTYLAEGRQPLREAEDIYERYRDKGEFHGYGEYTGPIAQQADYQSARRLAPYPFAYGTFQMMLKDGGVCGTMANMETRSQLALGVPSTTAGQPGHCALVYMRYVPATKTYELSGGQFVTGGPDKTTPHMPWIFGSDVGGRGMIYPMTSTWAVNYGFSAFLDSSMAWKFFGQLPADERKAHGTVLLRSALAIDPYDIRLVESEADIAASPEELLSDWSAFNGVLAGVNKPGCPTGGLYASTVRDYVCRKLESMPVPADRALLTRLADFTEKSDDADAWRKFATALDGADQVKARLLDELKTGIAGTRTAAGTELLSKRILAVAKATPKSPGRNDWIQNLMLVVSGHETYATGKHGKSHADPCAAVIFKLAGKDAASAALAKAASADASRDLSKDAPDRT